MWTSDHDGTRCLGGFLRNRRERLSPPAVGLPGGGRRRTPGLRREEVATLAGISIDYLVRLEQGREIRPSTEVLDALAGALRLDADERAHLGRLATLAARGGRAPDLSPPPAVSRTTLALIERMGNLPACIMDGVTEVVAWSPGFERLMAPVGLFDLEPPNMLWFMFLTPGARSLYPEWEELAMGKVAHLAPEVIRGAGDPRLRELVGELSVASPDFSRMWAEHQVADKRRGTFAMDHPLGGELVLEYESLILADAESVHLVVYMPADAASERVLAELTAADADGAAGHLRLVAGS